MKLSANQKTALYIALMGCLTGLLIPFLPLEIANIYSAIPLGLLTISSTYLGANHDRLERP